MFKMRYAGLCCLFTAAAFPGVATTIQSSSYSDWTQTLTGSPSSEIISTLNSGTYSNTKDPNGVSSEGYVFSGITGSSWSLIDESLSSNVGLLGANDGIEVALPSSADTAIYIKVNTYNNTNLSNGSLTLTLSDGETFSINSGQFGLSLAAPISWYTLTASSGQQPFLEWAYSGTSTLSQGTGGGGGNSGGSGDPPPAPEAVTFALVGGGMLILFGAKRRFPNLTKFAS